MPCHAHAKPEILERERMLGVGMFDVISVNMPMALRFLKMAYFPTAYPLASSRERSVAAVTAEINAPRRP